MGVKAMAAVVKASKLRMIRRGAMMMQLSIVWSMDDGDGAGAVFNSMELMR